MADDRDYDCGGRIAHLRKALEDEGRIGELYSRNVVSHKATAALAKGGRLEDVGALIKQAFPDMQITVDDAVESGDKVTVRWTMRGTHSGAFRDVKPTGRPVEVTGVYVYRFVGDKIVETWGEFDAPMLARQCGDEVFQAVSLPPETRAVGVRAGARLEG